MALNDQLAERGRDVLAGVPELSERRLLGEFAFLVVGHMACGVATGDSTP
jgi:hypothetical protein